MPKQLEDGRTVEDVPAYMLEELDAQDFREVMTYVLRDLLNIQTVRICRSHERIQHISFTKGD